MKTRSMLGLLLVLATVGFVGSAGVASPADVGSPPPEISVGAAASGCFPVDECNVCCRQASGALICTDRACP